MPVSLLWQIVASISGISRCLSCFPRCTTCYFIVLSLMEQPRNQGTARTKGDRSHHFMVRTNLCVHTRKSQRCTPMSHNRSSMFLVWCVKKTITCTAAVIVSFAASNLQAVGFVVLLGQRQPCTCLREDDGTPGGLGSEDGYGAVILSRNMSRTCLLWIKGMGRDVK